MYLDKLANGIDPLTDQALPNDTVLNNVRLARCFFFTSDVLRRVIENSGEIQSTKRSKKAGFSLTSEQIASIQLSTSPILISDFVEKINAVIDTDSMKKISTTTITNWLLEKGFLHEVVKPDGKKARIPSPQGNDIGLSTEDWVTVRGTFTVVLYNSEAQAFILDNIGAITDEAQSKQ